MPVYPTNYLPIYRTIYLSRVLLSVWQTYSSSNYLSSYPPIHVTICLLVHLYLPIYLTDYLPPYRTICLSYYPSTNISYYPSTIHVTSNFTLYLPIYLAIHLPKYLTICPPIDLTPTCNTIHLLIHRTNHIYIYLPVHIYVPYHHIIPFMYLPILYRAIILPMYFPIFTFIKLSSCNQSTYLPYYPTALLSHYPSI